MRMSTTSVAEVDATAEFDDGGVLAVQTHERDLDLRVQAPEERPLSGIEPHAQLTISGADLTVDVVLDADALDALLDGLPVAPRGES
ncbi:hypothetical protein [Haloarcula salina]|uniref:Uncharacterized protein n=1 Tax=Haloarcula salina TaxID=1429914 RepID=A0AA41KFZ3_9EURY|nr:hypothetical protein [Haloarcula salina]MBV0900176.1 hypothetical protein [Haloarcula salina]